MIELLTTSSFSSPSFQGASMMLLAITSLPMHSPVSSRVLTYVVLVSVCRYSLASVTRRLSTSTAVQLTTFYSFALRFEISFETEVF